MKFAFIILNYNTNEQTEKCIDAILERVNDLEDFKIAVLDNGSKDSSCKYLIDNKYHNFVWGGQLVFIESKENLGFAGGNNLMYGKILQTGFKADFFVFLNNDVYLVSNDFCKQIHDEYKKSNFSVLGPRIILGNNCIDACPFELPSQDKIKNEIKYWKYAEFFSSLRLINIFLFFSRVKNLLKKNFSRKIPLIDKSKRKENVVLHGACLVFSRRYFEFYEEPFDSRTFLYKEEELLFLRLLKKNLVSVFQPNLIAFHEGGASTVKNKNMNQIFKFRARNYINSLKILLSEMESYENESD